MRAPRGGERAGRWGPAWDSAERPGRGEGGERGEIGEEGGPGGEEDPGMKEAPRALPRPSRSLRKQRCPLRLLTPLPCVPFGFLIVGRWALVHVLTSNCFCKMTLLRLLLFEEFGFWV